jgi:hypothetical protein
MARPSKNMGPTDSRLVYMTGPHMLLNLRPEVIFLPYVCRHAA